MKVKFSCHIFYTMLFKIKKKKLRRINYTKLVSYRLKMEIKELNIALLTIIN